MIKMIYHDAHVFFLTIEIIDHRRFWLWRSWRVHHLEITPEIEEG